MFREFRSDVFIRPCGAEVRVAVAVVKTATYAGLRRHTVITVGLGVPEEKKIFLIFHMTTINLHEKLYI